jgi:hypothetical protein
MSSNPGRTGASRTPAGGRVVPLYRKGKTPFEIVRLVKLSKRRVSQILRAAGFDPQTATEDA